MAKNSKTPVAPAAAETPNDVFQQLEAAIKAAPEGYILAAKSAVEAFAHDGRVEISQEDENGNVFVRFPTTAETLTNDQPPANTEGTFNMTSTAAPSAAPAVSTGFEIEDNVPLPSGKSRRAPGSRASKYPFDALEVGQSFFVPNSADMADAVVSMGSTVTSANARYSKQKIGPDGQPMFETVTESTYELNDKGVRVRAEGGGYIKTGSRQVQKPVLEFDRRFIVKEDTKNGVKGARIWREK